MTALEIGGILEQVKAIESWASGLKEDAQKRALNGEHIPGWKLVRGKATRKITSPYDAAEKLLGAGGKPEDIYSLKGITDLEKRFTKDGLKKLLGDLIQPTEPKPTLAKESDQREEYKPDNIRESDYFEEDLNNG